MRTINNQGNTLQIAHFEYANPFPVSKKKKREKEKKSRNQKYEANTKGRKPVVSAGYKIFDFEGLTRQREFYSYC